MPLVDVNRAGMESTGIPGLDYVIPSRLGPRQFCQKHGKYTDELGEAVAVYDPRTSTNYTVCPECFWEEIGAVASVEAKEPPVCMEGTCLNPIMGTCTYCHQAKCREHMVASNLCSECAAKWEDEDEDPLEVIAEVLRNCADCVDNAATICTMCEKPVCAAHSHPQIPNLCIKCATEMGGM